MSGFIPQIERLVNKFRKLPGVGYKSAVRLAYAVVDMPEEEAVEFADAIIDAKKSISHCTVCQNISDMEICEICSDIKRDRSIICVVEDSKDVLAIDKIRKYNGLFHVLGGLISPIDGIGPEQLKINELLKRLNGEVKEIIVATNPSIEGEATAMYIARLIKPLGVKTTRLAYGIPAGSELEYADEVTLYSAIEGRREI